MMLVPFLLIWGSFLNVLGYRLIRNESLMGRSHCIHCHKTIAWYDLVPLISWVMLKGKCRYCHQPISWLYPLIEILTTVSILILFLQKPWYYAIGYSFFFSALIVTIRSDIETYYISRWVTLYAIPIIWLLIIAGFLPISLYYSVISTLLGYFFLYTIGKLFYFFTNTVGIGQGDLELLAFIGSATGLFGIWVTVMIGSLCGSIAGIALLALKGGSIRKQKIPFGPFLAFGAMIYVIAQNPFTQAFFPYSILLL